MSEEITVKVPVTKRHIDNSDIGQPTSCMVSNALRDALDLDPTKYVVDTGYGRTAIKVKKGKSSKVVFSRKHSASERQKIQQFDADNSKVKPYEIEWTFPRDWREQLLKAAEPKAESDGN
jgi:pullulanase/glycogen debranching enzyme